MAYQPKSYRKFVATTATAAMVASAVAPVVSAASFTDVAPQYKDAIDFLVSTGATNGKTPTKFGVYDEITRLDAAVILAKVLKLDVDNAKDAGFTDVPKDRAKYVNALVDAGILDGKEDGKFGAYENLTRVQMAKIIANAYNLKGDDVKLPFTDVNDTWAPFVKALYKNGVTKGKTETKFGAYENITRGDFARFVYRAHNVTVAPQVVEVSAINGTTLQIKFNKAVNASSLYDPSTNVIDSNALKITATSSAAPVTATNLLGSLSADGKVLTVTVKGGSEYFDGTYAVELMKDKVALKDNASVYVNEYKGLVTVSDKEGPTITGVSYDASDAIVTFSEALKSEGTVSLNGVQLTPGTDYDFTVGEKELRIKNLEAGKSYTLAVVSAKDVAGNFSTPNTLTYTLNVPTDNVKPTVAVSVDGTKATFKFSENLKLVDADGDSTAAEYAKITLGNGSVKYLTATEQDSTDKTKFVLDLNGELTGDFLNTTIKVEGFQDKAGNTGDAYTTSVTLQKDKTAPKFVSAMVKDNNLIIKYDEDVEDNGLAASDLTIKFVDSEGVLHPAVSPATIGAVTGKYDANGNGKIDGDEENYIVIPITDSNFLDASNKLKAGNYTVTIAADKVVDTAATPNKAAATTFTVSVSADTTVKEIVELVSATQKATPGEIEVVFNNNMGPSALVATNYKLGGVTLPSSATLTFVGDKKHVLITLPEGYITANGDRVLEVANVKDVDGNILKPGKTSVVVTAVKENVAPTATKVTLVDDSKITVTFSEKLGTLPSSVTGVKVKVNGTEVSVTPSLTGDNEVTFTAASGTFKLTDTITVEFNNTNITDVNGNAVKNATLTK
jgi:S-layer homology domain